MKSWNGESVSPTLTRENASGSQRMPDKDNFNAVIEEKSDMPKCEVQSENLEGEYGTEKEMKNHDGNNRKYCVRRLTPLECCRLQGFPDWWEDGCGGSDSQRYRMWGNGVGLPCTAFVLSAVKKLEEIDGGISNEAD